jgi:TRAP-type C4-dicarboxylate transport system substrate-binding protein
MLAAILFSGATLLASPATATAGPAREVTVKLATLTPEGSIWDKAFKNMGAEWKRATAGRVDLRVYASGVAGDESDVIRKMRIGQLGGAFLSASGLGTIDPSFKIFEVPMFFESAAELYHVLDRLTPRLQEDLERKGFVFLGWGLTGWVRLFSTAPVRDPDDLRRLKYFLWGADNRMAPWWEEQGFHPVPISVTDVPTALQTGMVEAMPAPPLHALTLQWFRSANFMLDYDAMPYLGALVLTEKTWSRLDEADRAAILAAADEVDAHLREEVPRQEARAIAEMQERGLTVTHANEAGIRQWQDLAMSFAQRMARDFIPDDFYDAVLAARDEHRLKSGE